MFNVLVLCTGNSARSILAESILNAAGSGRLRAYSAGSNPTGQVNRHAVALLERRGLMTAHPRSKSWDEFAGPGAPRMGLVITVCASAAAETCPVWPGEPLRAHWPVDDPASAPADQIDVAFQSAFDRLERMIAAFLALPFESMAGNVLARRLEEIGMA